MAATRPAGGQGRPFVPFGAAGGGTAIAAARPPEGRPPRAQGHCFNCGAGGHYRQQCTKESFPCGKCNRKHVRGPCIPTAFPRSQ
jgi:hypothetical protein